MKGPMKGATIAHAKQRQRRPRYIGITEPGIIAAESPNPIVNQLVIMPDIEKRLESFVRLGHGIIVFPGGVGTAEEIRSEEHTSELQSLMRISYAVFCLK